MFVVLGLIILVAAVVVGVAGVFNNVGSGHALTHGFSVFGYHVTGSTGALFLYGIVVGAAAILGLGLLLAGARRTSRRGRAARRELKQSRGQTAVSQDRDLIGQRESAQAETARSERPGRMRRPARRRPGRMRRPARRGPGRMRRPARRGPGRMRRPGRRRPARTTRRPGRMRRSGRRRPARTRRPAQRGPARMRRPGRRPPARTTRRPGRMRRPGEDRPGGLSDPLGDGPGG